MPIYEFLCKDCNTIFNFFSRRVNTDKVPACPQCGRKLQKLLSSFATTGRANEPGDEDLPPGFDEAKMERALGDMAQEAEKMNEDDPKAMARLTGLPDWTSSVSSSDSVLRLVRIQAGLNRRWVIFLPERTACLLNLKKQEKAPGKNPLFMTKNSMNWNS